MALFTNLPVYKLGYDLLIEIYKRTKLFSKEYKYTLGEQLKKETLQLLISIYKANKSKPIERSNFIESARQHLEVIRLLLRLSKDLHVLGTKGFVYLNVQAEQLSIQLVAWQKYAVRASKVN